MSPVVSQFGGKRTSRAFTLLELVTALTIGGLIAAVALPTYRSIVERQKAEAAGRDLLAISMSIQQHYTRQFQYPMSLEEIGADQMVDPWGNPYQYLNFDADVPGIDGKIRKDHNLHPINSAFDLYSKGPDGQSRSPLTARQSRDDIIWARDGAFIGPAADF